MSTNIPTISYRDLNPDDCNVKDHVFLQAARDWMASRMSAVSMELLADSEGNHDHEEWELVGYRERYVVEETTFSRCTHCGCATEDEECCELERYVVTKNGDDVYMIEDLTDPDDYELVYHPDGRTWETRSEQEANEHAEQLNQDNPMYAKLEQAEAYLVRDTHTGSALGECLSDHPGDLDHYAECVDGTALWLDEPGEHEIEAANRESVENDLLAFPFGHGWGRIVDSVDVDLLTEAGFLVYEFRGFTIAGIDGVGYSHEGAHYTKLYALWSIATNNTVPTENGEVYLTMGEVVTVCHDCGVGISNGDWTWVDACNDPDLLDASIKLFNHDHLTMHRTNRVNPMDFKFTCPCCKRTMTTLTDDGYGVNVAECVRGDQ